MKIAMACAVLSALLAMPAHAIDERASSAGPVASAATMPPVNPAAASSSSLPVSPSSSAAAEPSAPAVPPLAAIASVAVAPVSALPAAPSAMIQLKASRVEHNFFDSRNSLALGVLAAGLAADAISTQKGLAYSGFYEMNPLARPFVNSRSGAAIYSAGSFGLLATGMYLAHRTHHHKLERILPYAVGGWEGLLSFRNYHVISQHTR